MEELKNIKVALLGSGTVGTGVYKLIERQREELPHKVGAGLTVSKVLVRDKNKKREGIDPSVLTDQWEDIITDDEIQIVVEVMGGIEPARTYITEALQAGKNVVTANKDLMAVHGGELLDIASHNGCDLLFEASVAGGIPIIRPLKQCLAGNYISEAMGIVNGTTNFILISKDMMQDVRWRSWHPLRLTLESHLMMYTQKESQISQQKISNMQKQWDVRSNC